MQPEDDPVFAAFGDPLVRAAFAGMKVAYEELLTDMWQYVEHDRGCLTLQSHAAVRCDCGLIEVEDRYQLTVGDAL